MAKSTYAKRNGHERYKVVHKSRNPAAQARKKKVLIALEEDLSKKLLRTNGGRSTQPLTDGQIKRIKKEIEHIKAKL